MAGPIARWRRWSGALLLAALTTAATAQDPAQAFRDLPAAEAPERIGRILSERFVAGPYANFNNPAPATYITYPEVCTWYGALRYAQLANQPDLQQALIRRFDPILGPEAKLIPAVTNVDFAVFGALPLELALQTGERRYLDLGLRIAHEQWAAPSADHLAGLPPDAREIAVGAVAEGLSWHTRYWIDDMFMITLLQAQAYRATGDSVFIDRSAREMVSYLDRMQQPGGLFHHAPDVPFYWARGNGWFAAGMTELLLALPSDHPSHPRILRGYHTMMAALLEYQAPSGMWRQLIDGPDSWEESSGTAMFCYAFITGVTQGWLPAETYGPAARRAWTAVVRHIDDRGAVRAVCEGTNKLNNRQYYLDRKRVTGDLHGQAPVLWCVNALLRAVSTHQQPATPPLADTAAARRRPQVLDMVHHNPGGERYQTSYDDPATIARMGYNGKVYFLFDSPMLAVNWESVDPDIFPAGSPGRIWVDEKAQQIDRQHAACRAQGIATFAMSDLVLLPKTLIAREHMDETFGDPLNPKTRHYLQLLVDQMFTRFPHLDGLVVRIGETYLHDAPFHRGSIKDKRNVRATIVPLLTLLRDEICMKRNKQLIFRTWLSFDTDAAAYLDVSNAVEPHPNLSISVKHCEGDFHRGNPFSRIIGLGRHPQIIEVQCSREYEGKGAYPNYIAAGVIDGFEEHQVVGGLQHPSIGAFARTNPLYAGIWTWTRGGGWDGPFIHHELWADLNAWVLAQWAAQPQRSESEIFHAYATEKLGLDADNASRFRQLCLLSARAVLLGKTGGGDLSPWWSRDDGINAPELPADPAAVARITAAARESVTLWQEIVGLADCLSAPDVAASQHVRVSARYGLQLYRIYAAFIEMSALAPAPDVADLRPLLAEYDDAWTEFRELARQNPNCASLYHEKGARFGAGAGIDEVVSQLRARASAKL